jgi:hypothetical protein
VRMAVCRPFMGSGHAFSPPCRGFDAFRWKRFP